MLEPLSHIEDYGDKIVIYVDLPFVRKEDIFIYLRKNILEIKATAKSTPHFGFFEYKSFKKIIKLPCEVEEKTAKARFQNGILKIILKKKIKGEIRVI
ncbi:MAG: hypothetical protein DRN95_09405 [Candidatus Hydrothermarchaeota archaeon]|nr:MAG: hypothetical protein DRN95_09405 [Candidatus Hydrothermarchaeota archaeon]